MRSDLVSVLSEGTLSDHVEECAAFISRALPEAERPAFIQELHAQAAKADEASDADTRAQISRAVVADLVKKTPGMIEGTDREVEGVFNLLITLIRNNYREEEARDFLLHLVGVVSETGATAGQRVAVKYRILANVFNTLPAHSAVRLEVFEALLALTAHNGDLDYLNSAIQALPSWLVQWKVSPEQVHSCLDKVADALRSSERAEYSDRAFEIELMHLRWVSQETSLSKEVRLATAENVVAAALRQPKLFDFGDIVREPVVAELNGTPLFSLLKIFVGGSRSDLDKWLAESESASTLERLSLDKDGLVHKMQLLDLSDLCAGSVSSEVTYAQIAETLAVDESDVETWVIDVIRAGLVSGKLSQVKRSFRVYRSAQRSFEKPQWEALEKRLVQWQSSISSLKETVRKADAQLNQRTLLETEKANAPESTAAPAS
ncbi:hypothetical protein MCUN1_001359 [Malassezia cuniculi]|uniref:Eukaryotic translation initiation factor 3 subunit M n=1 Tax=Malassezia cuniculi TaxID=948313 RepID=A0AAF0EPL6_9BASI|nr:hypothetical protein MCUN1_001359 [Malassezia cuniculi]